MACMYFASHTLCTVAGNFRGRKLSRIGRKGAFRGENFRGMLKTGRIMGVACLEYYIFVEKTFADG